MKLGEALKTNHKFVEYSYDVGKNVAVYRTQKGPIFCVYGSTGVVVRYIKSKDGSKLTTLDCSPDLRSEKMTQEKLEAFHLEIHKKCESRNTVSLVQKIMRLAARLEENLEKRSSS